ncbi:hypothetical protein M514_08325 [Trichuris suis]|uniref:Adenylate cyclase type 9 n=1 Tax=Trichuris suis TaxID=68888 RepID=A0A085N1R2_9BILA|nr:hypothetical protein M514_08325 [Trichuris suis]
MDSPPGRPVPLPRLSKLREAKRSVQTSSESDVNKLVSVAPTAAEANGDLRVTNVEKRFSGPSELPEVEKVNLFQNDTQQSLNSDGEDSDGTSWSSDDPDVSPSQVHEEKALSSVLSVSPTLIPFHANICFLGWLRARKPNSKSKSNYVTNMEYYVVLLPASSSVWGVLKDNELKFYRSDTCEKLLDSLPCANILLVSKQSSPDFGPYLAVHYVHPRHRKTKCRLLCVDNEQDLSAWITFIGKSTFDEEMSELDGILDAVGKAYVKQGSTAKWTTASLAKRGFSLYYSTKTSECMYELDIRKVYSLKTIAEKQDSCPLSKEKGAYIAILMENSTLCLQADSKKLTRLWRTIVECVLGRRSNLLSEQRLSSDDVPMIVEKCVNFISIHDPFRVHLLPEEHSVHTVASVLRKFFAQLEEPLVPTDVTSRLLKHASSNTSAEVATERYKNAIQQLPRVNYATLRKLIKHLKEVTLYSEVNKMNVQNLACIFCPTLFRLSYNDGDTEQVRFESSVKMFKVIADLILHYDYVFDISMEESYREFQVHKALSKLDSAAGVPVKLSSGFLHCLHVIEKDKISFNIKIGVDLSAEKVCDYVRTRDIPSLPTNLALHEVICDGQLERVVSADESVFDIIMRWISWPLSDRVGNYLIVKVDQLTDKALRCVQSSSEKAHWITTYVSLSKAFVKHVIVLMPNEVMLFRNQKLPVTIDLMKFQNTVNKSFISDYVAVRNRLGYVRGGTIIPCSVGARFRRSEKAQYGACRDTCLSNICGSLDESAEQVWRISDYLWFVGTETKRHPPSRYFAVSMLLACSCLADAARQLVAPSVQRLVSFFCLSLFGMKSNNLARPLRKESVYDTSSIPMISDHLAFPYESRGASSREYLGKKRRQKAWTLFDWSFSRCWSPEFSSRVLESQYWQCAFPQIRLRFRAGLAYTIIYTIVWMTYFAALYPLSEITNYVIFSTLVLVIFVSVFAFTFTNSLYCRLYVPTSVFCICLVAVSSVFVFMVEKPALTPLARFALSVEVVLLIYTVIPLPMYLCVVLALAFSILFEELRLSPTSSYRPRGVMFSFYTLAHILGVHIFVLMQVRDRKTFIKVGQSLLARKDLEIEKEFKDRMIGSVMPRMVAEELLKESNELKRPSNTPDRGSNLFRPFTMNLMHNVSILFADIVGFTKMSSNKSADELVNMLNDLFGRFDALCGKCGCEKISTLGDCYYCVSGCPEPRADHAICCVEMGLSMIEAIHQFDIDREQEVNMRVGIHTGTVLCGIVGRRRFKFDVFSNDVDLANMMESTGQSGRVHISESTAKFLGNEYILEEGPVYKNKLRTYFIADKESRTKRDATSSPPVFGVMPSIHRLTDLRHIDSSDITISAKDISKKTSSFAQQLNKTQSVHNLFSEPDPSKAKNGSEFSLSVHPCFKENKSASTTVIDPHTPSRPALSSQGLGSRNSRNVTFKPSLSECDELVDRDKIQSQSASAKEQPAEKNGVESSIDHVLSTHTASISRFEASHVDFDMRLAEAIRGSSLAEGDYLIRRKALNPFTLKFIDPVVETKYRRHFCAEPPGVPRRNGFVSTLTGITRHQERGRDQWQVDAPKMSVLFDALISILMFIVLNSLAFFGFGVSNIGFVVYVLLCLLFIVAFLCLTAFYLRRHGTLPPVLVKWWPKHVFSLLLINLPLGIMLTNLHCPAEQFSFIQTVNMGENYLLFICLMIMMVMFGHVNFSQIRSWPKSVSCFLLGLGLIGLVQFCLHSCDGETLILVNMALANLSSRHNFVDGNATAGMSLLYNISGQISGTYSDSKACFQTEIYIVVFLSFLLIVFVNYQFEASFRMSFYGDMQACETIRKMKEMKDQADWLLSNIIPHHVVEHLARTSKYSENHEMIAVLFASIVNWNEMYEETYEGGREFLRVLNELISDFDELLDRPEFIQVEKIKTIGPTYMAAAGLNPERRRLSMHPYSHLYALMEFALALQETLDNFNKDLLSFEFIMKIGYNIGPVTAGVIGTTKLYYDIWGDTVNISSRMYSTGVKGRIQVSRQAKDRLESVYDFEFRDHIDIKGVDGGMDVFLLKQRKQNMTPRLQKPLELDGP